MAHWEYWPFGLVYFPIYPVWLWLAAKSRSLFFFGSSNPGIPNAGFLMESKQVIYNGFPEHLMPPTFLVEPGTSAQAVLREMQHRQIGFPIILKPDIGMRGQAVYKLTNTRQLTEAIGRISIPFVIQPFVPYPNEIGVFFVRTADQPAGFISGVVKKEFVAVTGDGQATIRQLLQQNRRYALQLPILEQLLGNQLNQVLPENKTEILVPFGNHARGALFLDVTRAFAPRISPVICNALSSVPDFCYGRLDIRYQSLEDLEENRHWTIIEANGAGSEPTHMYDPSHSLLFAWKEIIHHWHLLYLVSEQNRRAGYTTMSFKDGLAMYRSYQQYKALLASHHTFELPPNEAPILPDKNADA